MLIVQKKGENIEIITNQTPFYGESGGQVGDQGKIFNSNCKIEVVDTQKNERPICSLWQSNFWFSKSRRKC